MTILYNARRYGAMDQILAECGSSVEIESQQVLHDMYMQIVPEDERARTEASMIKAAQKADDRSLAAPRFSVFHIRQYGLDTHFISGMFTNLLSTAHQYRVYFRNLNDPDVGGDSLPGYFIANRTNISEDKYQEFCDPFCKTAGLHRSLILT